MSNFAKRRSVALSFALISVAATLLGGCRDDLLDRRDGVTMGIANTQATNRLVQTIEPWPRHANSPRMSTDGELAKNAIELMREKPKSNDVGEKSQVDKE